METERIVYSKEELARRVRVPASVEEDLKRIISERLEQCGFYFRVFSRIKSAASMARKFRMKEYGEERRLQDLIGVRINLYFDDDVDICKTIMSETFELLEWSKSERSEEEFKPIKLNGVFRLPEYLKAEISADTWEMQIDDTFELQIKTMFFEGWHEIEHDMRYKGEELWSHFPGFSRYFNSILATLELCDKSMVTLFEDLGHALYKSGQWTDMIRSHFRLKMDLAELYPEVEQVLNEDKKNPENLGKRIYRTKKKELIFLLKERERPIPINVNTIIAVLNEGVLHDERLTAIFRRRDVYNDGQEDSLAETRNYQLRPLVRHPVFQMAVFPDGSRMREKEKPSLKQIFDACAEAIYQWARSRYGVLFTDMPAGISSYGADLMSCQVLSDYRPERLEMDLQVRHVDLETGGRVWYSQARLERRGEKLYLGVCSGYAEPSRENERVELPALYFSYPGFYKTIVDTVGIEETLPLASRRRIIQSGQTQEMAGAIRTPQKAFPIVLIISPSSPEGLMDESWLGAFRVSDFIRTVWRYAHVLTCYEDVGVQILREVGYPQLAEDPARKLIIFWPDREPDVYTPEDVESSSFGRHLEARNDARTYDIVYGGQAFYHKIVTKLRAWNVSSGMWEEGRMEPVHFVRQK